MRTSTSLTIVALAGLATSALAGPLAPPAGPVTSTHKTLTEIEPRIPINANTAPGDAFTLHVITAPGSYYLTGDITGVAGKVGIRIKASDVVLDLNGFSVIGVPGASTGIFAQQNDPGQPEGYITVRNGTVRGWPSSGVSLQLQSRYVTVCDLKVHNNGTYGVEVGEGSLVERVHANDNGIYGIDVREGSIVRDCTAIGNDRAGIYSARGTVSGCTVMRNGSLTEDSGGIDALGGQVIGCQVQDNEGFGILAKSRSTVRANSVTANKRHGIQIIGSDCHVEGNHVTNHIIDGTVGIYAFSANAHPVIRNNVVMNNETGYFAVTNSGAVLTGNVAGRNEYNYYILSGNRFAPIVNSATNSTNALIAPGGSAAGTINPSNEANISY